MAKLALVFLFLLCFIVYGQASTYTNNNAGLTAVPSSIPITTVTVNLKANSLTIITSVDFSLLDKLKNLYLNTNNISSISPNAFDNTPLERLDLSQNPIKTVPFFPAIDSTLIYLSMSECQISNSTWNHVVLYSKLLELRLNTNQLTTLPNVTKSAATLRVMELSTNKIQTFDAAKLDGCNALIWLSVSGNTDFKHINGCLKLPAMATLTLAGDALDQFPNISGMPNLAKLNIEANEIQHLPKNSFVNNQRLAYLFISRNRFSQMPDLHEIENSLQTLRIGSHPNITGLPTDYFSGFSKLSHIDFTQNSIDSLTFAQSFGPSVQHFIMNGNKITNVPAGTFINATGMINMNFDANQITDFDISNIQYMPQLGSINLRNNQLTRVKNASTYCRGLSCTTLTIELLANPVPCDKYICWAKMNSSIKVTHNGCSGKPWINVTVDDLPCPTEKVMKLVEKQGFTGTFMNYDLQNYDYKKIQLGSMLFMKCVGTCLRTDDCHYFKHGNTTQTNAIDHKYTRNCTIWTPGP